MNFKDDDKEMLKTAASIAFCTVFICSIIWWLIAH